MSTVEVVATILNEHDHHIDLLRDCAQGGRCAYMLRDWNMLTAQAPTARITEIVLTKDQASRLCQALSAELSKKTDYR